MRARPRVIRRILARSITVLVTTVVLGGMLSATAHADDQPVDVGGVTTAPSGGIDVLLADPSALWVQVTVRGADSSALAVTDDLTYSYDRGWSTDEPIVLAGAALGDYPVDVDYRLATGTVQHWSGAAHGSAGVFHYARHVAVTSATTNRNYTDYDHRAIVVTGAATVFDPQTGTSGPADDGTSVAVSWDSATDSVVVHHSTTVPTSAGRFVATVTPDGGLSGATATVVAPPAHTLAGPAFPLPDVAVRTLQARVILSSSQHIRIHAGKTVVVSGVVQRLSANDGWQPLAGAAVVSALGAPQYPGDVVHGQLATATSTASGHFSMRFTARNSLFFETFARPTPYLPGSAAAEVNLSVPRNGSFGRLKITLDPYGAVRARGVLRGPCGDAVVVLQYSRNGRTGWVNLGHVTTDAGFGTAPCPVDITKYGYVAGYYRLLHTESDQLLTTTSSKAYRHRTPTRITGFAVTPVHPSANGTLTATGTVSQRPGRTWSALRNAHVVLVFRPSGDSTYYRAAVGTTTSSGRFTLSSRAYGDGAWAVYYSADTTHFYSQTGLHNVDVR